MVIWGGSNKNPIGIGKSFWIEKLRPPQIEPNQTPKKSSHRSLSISSRIESLQPQIDPSLNRLAAENPFDQQQRPSLSESPPKTRESRIAALSKSLRNGGPNGKLPKKASALPRLLSYRCPQLPLKIRDPNLQKAGWKHAEPKLAFGPFLCPRRTFSPSFFQILRQCLQVHS